MAATKFTTKTGTRNGNVLVKVTRLRNQGNSWKVIADSLGIAPRTARRLYDEKNGEGSHHGLIPGKGGRTVTAA